METSSSSPATHGRKVVERYQYVIVNA